MRGAKVRVSPSCLEAWKARIGELPNNIGERYNLRLLTPKDWHSHFKNVLHRAMRVKGNDSVDKACRACGHVHENLQHLATCGVVAVFAAHARLTKTEGLDTQTKKERYNLFAITPSGLPLEEGWINLHLLLWKFVIFYLGSPIHGSKLYIRI